MSLVDSFMILVSEHQMMFSERINCRKKEKGEGTTAQNKNRSNLKNDTLLGHIAHLGLLLFDGCIERLNREPVDGVLSGEHRILRG